MIHTLYAKRFTRFCLLILCISYTSVFTHAQLLKSESIAQKVDNKPTIRSTGDRQEILIRGQILDSKGQPAQNPELSINFSRNFLHANELQPEIKGHQFEVWVPYGHNENKNVYLRATTADRQQIRFLEFNYPSLRQLAIEGISVQLKPADRKVEVLVVDQGRPVSGALVDMYLTDGNNYRIAEETDQSGKAVFNINRSTTPATLFAITSNQQVGLATCRYDRLQQIEDEQNLEFTIELEKSQELKFRVVNLEDGSPVANEPVYLILNKYVLGNISFRLVNPHGTRTDEQGIVSFSNVPESMSILDTILLIPGWDLSKQPYEDHTVVSGVKDGMYSIQVKPTQENKIPAKISGKLLSDHKEINPSGVLIEAKTYHPQAKKIGESVVYAVTDNEGNFELDCIADATYCVYVSDQRISSNFATTLTSKSGEQASEVSLRAVPNVSVQLKVVFGSDRKPVTTGSVVCGLTHYWSWEEDGKRINNSSPRVIQEESTTSITGLKLNSNHVFELYEPTGPKWKLYPNENGIVQIHAPAGSILTAKFNGIFEDKNRTGSDMIPVRENDDHVYQIHIPTQEPRSNQRSSGSSSSFFSLGQ